MENRGLFVGRKSGCSCGGFADHRSLSSSRISSRNSYFSGMQPCLNPGPCRHTGDAWSNPMDVLNVIKAADYTRLSKSSLDKLRVYGGGPLYIKVGARVVYDRIDLDTWLIGKKVANTSQPVAVAS